MGGLLESSLIPPQIEEDELERVKTKKEEEEEEEEEVCLMG